jgi:hypothetical protein
VRAAVLCLAALAAFAVAIRTVAVRVDMVRAGYQRSRLQAALRAERDRNRALEAEIAAATAPAILQDAGARLGVDLVERCPTQIVVAPPPAFVGPRGEVVVNR